MKELTIIAVGPVILTLALSVGWAQNPPANDQPVTREEYNRLKKELDAVKEQLQQLKPPPKAEAASKETEEALDEMQKQIKDLKDQAAEVKPGVSRFDLVGLAYVNFATKDTDALVPRRNQFQTQISPTFLYRPSDRMLVEAEPELKLNSTKHDEFGLELEQCHTAYLLNDLVTLDAGQFLNPGNVYGERLHQVWIEKTPSKALGLANDSGAVLPQEHLGFQARGGAPVGPVQLDYAAFIANGPKLIVGKASDDEADDGLTGGNINFDSFANLGNSFAYGGHLGVLPIPGLELGYGVELDDAAPEDDGALTGAPTVGAILQTVDANYVLDSSALMGTVDLKAQWAWQHIGAATYLGDSPIPGTHTVNRNGGYARIAYRPTKVKNLLKDFEALFRYDWLHQRNTPSGYDQNRYTVGLDYWLNFKSAVKIAYQFDRREGKGPNSDAIVLQWATGF